MENTYEFLVQKEAMWAHMLMQVLRDNGIPAVSKGINGAGFSIKTGVPDFFDIYVPAEHLQTAQQLLHELFSGEYSEQ